MSRRATGALTSLFASWRRPEFRRVIGRVFLSFLLVSVVVGLAQVVAFGTPLSGVVVLAGLVVVVSVLVHEVSAYVSGVVDATRTARVMDALRELHLLSEDAGEPRD